MLGRPRTPRHTAAAAFAIAALLLVGIPVVREVAEASDAPPLPRPDSSVAILDRSVGGPIAPGFVGVSFEYPALTAYAGTDPHAVNPVLANLLRDLTPGASPIIRIGGNSTDTTWWPTPGLTRPGGVSYALSPRWLAVVAQLAKAVNGKLILGIDQEALPADVGWAEARAFIGGLPSARVLALELSNEASRYAIFPWYHAGPRQPVFARPRSYDFQAFAAEFGQLAGGIPRSATLAGPTLAGDGWMAHLGAFLAHQRRLGLVTFHRYPLNRCFTSAGSPHYPTIGHLLSPAASQGFAASVAASVTIAHRRGLPVRLDELNSVACGGKNGVSNTFASALWAIDTLFALAKAGVSGVNFHTFPAASYALFHFRRGGGRWEVNVAPEYYGLLMFALGARPGSELLATSTLDRSSLRCWATRGTDGTLRVTLINDDLAHRRVVLVRLPLRSAAASVLSLTGPGAGATHGVRLGGAGFDSRGQITGVRETRGLSNSPGEYLVTLPRASAALLIVHPDR